MLSSWPSLSTSLPTPHMLVPGLCPEEAQITPRGGLGSWSYSFSVLKVARWQEVSLQLKGSICYRGQEGLG